MRSLHGSLFFVLFGLLLLLGCSTEKTPSNSEVDRAIYLIDVGQKSEAIYVMTSYLQRYPQDQRARLVLASAYASRLGLNLAQFAALAQSITQWNRESAAAKRTDGDPDLDALNSVFQKLYGITRFIKTIPTIYTPEQKTDLETAIAVLGGNAPIYGGSSLYRGSLKIVLFKENLLHGSPTSVARKKKCAPVSGDVAKWLQAIQQDLVQALYDLAFGLSDQNVQARMVAFGQALDQAIALLSGRRGNRELVPFQDVLSDIYPECF